jgi:uncharacterized alkaline shock family protein YloU
MKIHYSEADIKELVKADVSTKTKLDPTEVELKIQFTHKEPKKKGDEPELEADLEF